MAAESMTGPTSNALLLPRGASGRGGFFAAADLLSNERAAEAESYESRGVPQAEAALLTAFVGSRVAGGLATSGARLFAAPIVLVYSCFAHAVPQAHVPIDAMYAAGNF
jgi:hypothetical protein